MKRDSESRGKRYYEDLGKPHIALSKFGYVFFVGGTWKGEDNRFDLAVGFSNKLNAERAKS